MNITEEDLGKKDSLTVVVEYLNSLPHIIQLIGETATKEFEEKLKNDFLLFLNMQTDHIFVLSKKKATVYVTVNVGGKSPTLTAIGSVTQQVKYLNTLKLQADALDGTLIDNIIQAREDKKSKKHLL